MLPPYPNWYISALDNKDAPTQSGEQRVLAPLTQYEVYHSVWVAWTAPASGVLEADTLQTAGADTVWDTTLAIFTGSSLAHAKRIAYDDDWGSGYYSEVLGVPIKGGVTYHFQVGTSQTGTGATSLANSGSGYSYLNVLANYVAPANDNFASPISETAASWTSTSTTVGSTIQYGEDTANSINPGEPRLNSIWWKWTPAAAGTINVTETLNDLEDVNPNSAYLAIYKQDAGGKTSLAEFDQPGVDGPVAVINLPVKGQYTYYFQVGQVAIHANGPVTLQLFASYTGPIVSHLSASHGSHHGGQSLTLSGVRLGSVTEVCFGNDDCFPSITSVTSTKVKVTVPAGVKGKVPVYVVSDDSGSDVTSHTYYTFT